MGIVWVVSLTMASWSVVFVLTRFGSGVSVHCDLCVASFLRELQVPFLKILDSVFLFFFGFFHVGADLVTVFAILVCLRKKCS